MLGSSLVRRRGEEELSVITSQQPQKIVRKNFLQNVAGVLYVPLNNKPIVGSFSVKIRRNEPKIARRRKREGFRLGLKKLKRATFTETDIGFLKRPV